MGDHLCTITLVAKTHEVTIDDDFERDVPALFVEGVEEPIWVADPNVYWDEYDGQGGGNGARDVIADALRLLFASFQPAPPEVVATPPKERKDLIESLRPQRQEGEPNLAYDSRVRQWTALFGREIEGGRDEIVPDPYRNLDL
jgi:hypothetical protein